MHCLAEGADIGKLMIKTGFARASNKYYQEAEAFAKEGRLGIWK